MNRRYEGEAKPDDSKKAWYSPPYSCSMVQIYSLLGGEFAKDSASAFAILMFMQAASSACAFAYSSKIWLWWQLLIGKDLLSV
jgi:hypothetical protein